MRGKFQLQLGRTASKNAPPKSCYLLPTTAELDSAGVKVTQSSILFLESTDDAMVKERGHSCPQRRAQSVKIGRTSISSLQRSLADSSSGYRGMTVSVIVHESDDRDGRASAPGMGRTLRWGRDYNVERLSKPWLRG